MRIKIKELEEKIKALKEENRKLHNLLDAARKEIETWKAPTPELKGSFPMVIYFKDNEDRKELIRMVKQVRPGMVMKNL